jgi:NAD(P)H-dependent FMN reductase
MDGTRNVAVIVGSLRKDSINRKVANALAELAPAALKLSIVDIGYLPIYNQDGDENPPAAWTEFRELVFLNVPAMAQPEVYLGGADKLFDAQGKLANDGTRKFLESFMQAYAAWVAANAKS